MQGVETLPKPCQVQGIEFPGCGLLKESVKLVTYLGLGL